MKHFLYTIFLVTAFQFKAFAAIIYVDATATGDNNGTSWANAYTSLAEALFEANSHTAADSILIAAGTYYPTTASNPDDRDATFGIFRGGIKIYGGYPQGGGLRDVNTHRVFLDGEIGTAGATDNSYHVMVISNIAAMADSIVVDGLSVRNGSADILTFASINGSQTRRCYGGGIMFRSVANGGKTCIRQCRIEENFARRSFGQVPGPGPVGGSWVPGRGAGIYITQSSPTISDCELINNFALGSSGGGMYVDGGSPVVEYCTFKGNKARSTGSALAASGSSTPLIRNSTFTANLLDPDVSNPNLLCITIHGGTPTLINCLVYENQGLALDFDAGEVINCTVTRNQLGMIGGNVHIANSIFYGNTTVNIDDYENTMQIDHSLIGGGHAGIGNINSNPYFVSVSGNDYRLLSHSPAINSGDNLSAAGILEDLAGNPRITGNKVDMGAFEYPTDVAGISEQDLDGRILIYPNPAKNNLNIVMHLAASTTITDTFGKIVQSEQLQAGNNAMDVSSLAAGVYFIQVADGLNVKFIKE